MTWSTHAAHCCPSKSILDWSVTSFLNVSCGQRAWDTCKLTALVPRLTFIVFYRVVHVVVD